MSTPQAKGKRANHLHHDISLFPAGTRTQPHNHAGSFANRFQCNREWPCNHCQKRKVADRCSFNHDTDQNSAWIPSDDVKRKRERDSNDDVDEWDTAAGLEAIGYTSSHILANLEIDVRRASDSRISCVFVIVSVPRRHLVDLWQAKKKSGAEQYRANTSSSPQLQRALQILPPRQYIGKCNGNCRQPFSVFAD